MILSLFSICKCVELSLSSFALFYDHIISSNIQIHNTCIRQNWEWLYSFSVDFPSLQQQGKTDLLSFISVTSADSIEWCCHFHESSERRAESQLTVLFFPLLISCVCGFINHVAAKLTEFGQQMLKSQKSDHFPSINNRLISGSTCHLRPNKILGGYQTWQNHLQINTE